MVCVVIASAGYEDQWGEHSCKNNRHPEEELSRESDLFRDIHRWGAITSGNPPSHNFTIIMYFGVSYSCC